MTTTKKKKGLVRVSASPGNCFSNLSGVETTVLRPLWDNTHTHTHHPTAYKQTQNNAQKLTWMLVYFGLSSVSSWQQWRSTRQCTHIPTQYSSFPATSNAERLGFPFLNWFILLIFMFQLLPYEHVFWFFCWETITLINCDLSHLYPLFYFKSSNSRTTVQ